MGAASRPAVEARRSGDLAVIVAVAAAYVFALSSGALRSSTPTVALLIALGVLYSLVGTCGFERRNRTGSPSATLLYFAIQIPLGTAILYLTQSSAWMVMLPLAGQGAVALPRRWLLILCALLEIAILVPFALLANWGAVAQYALTYAGAIVFVVVFTEIAMREEKTRVKVEGLAAELGQANQKLRAYAVQVEELATAKERNRLAREIHDSFGHYLTAINVQIEAARAVMEADPPRARDALDKAQSLTKEGLGEVRRSVAALCVFPAESRHLPEALAALVDELRAAGILTALVVAGTPRPLPPPVALTLYRAAQEGLTNVRKHAHASRADLTLDCRADATVRLTVQDNGVGASAAEGGFGLLGLRERVQLLGGAVHVHTAAGQGFTLTVEVPA